MFGLDNVHVRWPLMCIRCSESRSADAGHECCLEVMIVVRQSAGPLWLSSQGSEV